MKQIEVQIMGQSYMLSCPDNGEARVLDAVSRVDMAMCKIRDVGKIKARDRIAVLAALNLAFELPDRSLVADAQVPLIPAATPNTAPTSTSSPGVDSNAAVQENLNRPLAGLLERLDAALEIDDRLL